MVLEHGGYSFVEFSLLADLYPAIMKNRVRIITTFLKRFEDAPDVSTVYMLLQGTYWIRTDIFDSIVIYHGTTKWTPQRIEYVRLHYPNIPIPSYCCGFPCRSEEQNRTVMSTVVNFSPILNHSQIISNVNTTVTVHPNDSRPFPRFKNAFKLSGLTEEKFWKALFWAVQDTMYMYLTPNGFTKGIMSFREKLIKKKAKNIVLHSFFAGQFPGYNEEELETRLYMELACGTSVSTICTIRQMLTLDGTMLTMLPSREKMAKMSKRVNADFIAIFNPRRTPTGYRVDLVRVVRFMVRVLHNKNDLEGVEVDIYGDAMQKGKKNVTRLLVRILTAVNADSKAQSSSYMFCFTAFRGKDSRQNLALNLGSFTELGARGWIFEETGILRGEKALLTLTGDAVFLMHMTTQQNSDNTTAPSKLEMYITEVDPIKLIELHERLRVEHAARIKLARTNEGHSTRKFNARRDCPDAYQQGLKDLDAVLPGTVDKLTNRRTRLHIELNKELPSASLISLDSIQCACPDPLHQMVRIVEVVIFRFAQNLLNNQKESQLQTLADNITLRGVKSNPRFSFEITSNSKGNRKVSRPSFSGSDALVIMANPDELKDSAVTDSLFNGVYRVGATKLPLELPSAKVLAELRKELVHVTDDGTKYFTFKEVAEANLNSLNECFAMLRSRKPWKTTIVDQGRTMMEKYKDCVDVFYASTDVLFSGEPDCDLTPYMLKLDLMWRLLDGGHIKHIWNHLGEGGEKSHHIATALYHNKTMRDGGSEDRHQVSEFMDIRYSFIQIGQKAMEKRNEDDFYIKSYSELIEVCRCVGPITHSRTYLDVTREKVPTPIFVPGVKPKGEQLKGLVIGILGNCTAKLKQKGKQKGEWETVNFNGNYEKLTQITLRKLVVSLGGMWYDNLQKIVMTPTSGYFCIVRNQVTLDYMATKIGTLESTKSFEETIRGPWKFKSYNFILDCYNNSMCKPDSNTSEVPDPFKYSLSLNTRFTRILKRQHSEISTLLSNQQNGATGCKTVSAISAYKKHKREQEEKTKKIKKKLKKRTALKISTDLTSRSQSTSQLAYNKFRKEISQTENETIREQRIQLESERSSAGLVLPTKEKESAFISKRYPLKNTCYLNQIASTKWRNLTKEERVAYYTKTLPVVVPLLPPTV